MGCLLFNQNLILFLRAEWLSRGGRSLFCEPNPNPVVVLLGSGEKEDLPPGVPAKYTPTQFRKNANGKYRLVYSGKDAQAGKNVNAIILEIPLSFITTEPAKNRIVNTWGESWVKKAECHREPGSYTQTTFFGRIWAAIKSPFVSSTDRSLASIANEQDLSHYKLVDTDGQAFADASLSEREDERQLGANNLQLGVHFVKRLGHLGWGFSPSVKALGLRGGRKEI